MRCYLFDLDGTICNIDHRLHHITPPAEPVEGAQGTVTLSPEGWAPNWDAFFAACAKDIPVPAICHLAHALMLRETVVFVSGRSDQVRSETVKWLQTYLATPSLLAERSKLYMRSAGDHRPDHIIKGEMLMAIRADGFEPIMAFDDRDAVVKMWREAGITCAQVAPGDF